MKQLLKWILVLAAPLAPLTLLGVLFLLHEAWEFITLPTSDIIERRIKAELPKGTDKAKVLDFLKKHELGGGELQKVTASDKKWETDYREEHFKGQIDLIEYEVGGGRWTASWGLWNSFTQVGFYFNKDEKLLYYTFHQHYDAL